MWNVNDLMDYWQDYPPTHVLVAAYVMGGNKGRSKKHRHGNNHNDAGNFNELAQVVSSAGGAVNKKLPEIYRREKKLQDDQAPQARND